MFDCLLALLTVFPFLTYTSSVSLTGSYTQNKPDVFARFAIAMADINFVITTLKFTLSTPS